MTNNLTIVTTDLKLNKVCIYYKLQDVPELSDKLFSYCCLIIIRVHIISIQYYYFQFQNIPTRFDSRVTLSTVLTALYCLQ